MSYFNNITNAIATLIDGMKVTMGYFVRPREYVTLQYPDEVWPIPSRNIGVGELDSYNTIRSKLTVDINDCIGCKACERACPVNCIKIDAYKGGPDDDLGITSNGTTIKLLVANFTIDMSECMFCDLCTHPCPEDCITMTPDYQFISNDNLKKDTTPEQRWRDKDHLIYQFSVVAEEERQRRKAEALEAAKAKAAAMAAKKAAAAKAAAEKAAQLQSMSEEEQTPVANIDTASSPVASQAQESGSQDTPDVQSTVTIPVSTVSDSQGKASNPVETNSDIKSDERPIQTSGDGDPPSEAKTGSDATSNLPNDTDKPTSGEIENG